MTFDRPAVMGILNITPDSFYDGGRYTEPETMLAQARNLLADGADIIDVGASSSRPGAILLPPAEEAARLAGAVKLLRAEMPETVISVDTCYAIPARAAVEAGANMVNDIGGGRLDEAMFATVAELQVPYILMHSRGNPGNMNTLTDYDDIVADLVKFFSSRLDELCRLGVADVWLDPGFGFAKTVQQNFELLNRLDELTTLFDQPVVAALSRKSMIYKTLGVQPADALNGTIALDAVALLRGARVLRVHDPKPAVETIKLVSALFESTTITQ
ncbi:MAG: dihydropteroate synthase [Bacteroidales bacterium]|nr:dihydropteroate synthase [Bacteroidales bacterium]